MLGWMVYAGLVSVLVAIGARALVEVAGALGRPVRFVWVAALVGTVALTALGPLRAPESVSVRIADLGGVGGGLAGPEESGGPAVGLRAAVQWSLEAVGWPVRVAASVDTPAAVASTLAAAWVGLAVLLVLVGWATLLRYRTIRRRWPRREVCGVAVRVAPAAGPAVLGLLRPEIVVPTWLTARPPHEQRLVILHEREHVRAGDGWTIAAGWLAVALVPWNPVAWWLWHRLRLAVELDCDARVLRHDVRRRAYGTMLIDVAGRGSGLTLGVPALSGSPTTLERRLIAMTAPFKQDRPVRAVAYAALGALAILAACESEVPTAADVRDMDAATAEAAAGKLHLLDPAGEDVTYFVDGREVDAEEARALAPEELARVEIVRSEESKGAVIRLRRVAEDGSAPEPASGQEAKVRVPGPGDGGFDGLLIIDGEVAPVARMGELRPSEIETVEVIKGAAAAAISDDPRAARGIIRVTTKAAAGGG